MKTLSTIKNERRSGDTTIWYGSYPTIVQQCYAPFSTKPPPRPSRKSVHQFLAKCLPLILPSTNLNKLITLKIGFAKMYRSNVNPYGVLQQMELLPEMP